MLIKKLPEKLRPREKAYSQGLNSLSDTELLAIFIRAGGKDNALAVGFNLISHFHSLENIGKASMKELTSISGIGKVKALELKALLEFHKRIKFGEESKITRINKKLAIKTALRRIDNFDQENFIVILLGRDDELIMVKKLYIGTKDTLNIEPKEIIGLSIKHGASKIYCFHNHPSGNTLPSKSDMITTSRLISFLEMFDISLVGHYVINADGDYMKIE